MSEQNETKNAEKLDVLFQKVYVPTLIEKLAERGLQINSEDELQDVLKIAAMARLHVDAEEPTVEGRSVIKEAAARLEDVTFGEQGVVDAILQDPDVASVFQD